MSTVHAGSGDWTVYTPGGVQARGALPGRMLRDLLFSRGMARRLLVRDLNARYRQSLLGYVWAFIPSIALVISFTMAGSAGVLNTQTTSVPYPLLALVGVVLWQTFSESITGPVTGIQEAQKVLARLSVQPEGVLLAGIGLTLFNLLVRLVLVAGVLCWYQVSVSPWMLAALPAMLVLVLFGSAIGFLIAPLAGLYKDVGLVLGMSLSAWFLLTPVMYEQAAPGSVIAWVNSLNPVTPLLTTARELIIGSPVSRPVAFWIVAVCTLVLLFLGWAVYRALLTYVVERQSA